MHIYKQIYQIINTVAYIVDLHFVKYIKIPTIRGTLSVNTHRSYQGLSLCLLIHIIIVIFILAPLINFQYFDNNSNTIIF